MNEYGRPPSKELVPALLKELALALDSVASFSLWTTLNSCSVRNCSLFGCLTCYWQPLFMHHGLSLLLSIYAAVYLLDSSQSVLVLMLVFAMSESVNTCSVCIALK